LKIADFDFIFLNKNNQWRHFVKDICVLNLNVPSGVVKNVSNNISEKNSS